MARALQYQQELRWPIRLLRIAALVLGLAATALEAAALRLARPAPGPAVDIEREFGVIEIDGRRVGVVYERGELVAMLDQERM